MCGCGIRGGCAQFQHCLQGKLVILEELNLTRDEKRKSDEERKKAEEKLGLAHKTIRELEEAMKRIDEKMKRVVEEKMRLELQLADTIDGHNINVKATRVKVHEIKKKAIRKAICLDYALGAIVILLVVIITMLGLFRCAK